MTVVSPYEVLQVMPSTQRGKFLASLPLTPLHGVLPNDLLRPLFCELVTAQEVTGHTSASSCPTGKSVSGIPNAQALFRKGPQVGVKPTQLFPPHP